MFEERRDGMRKWRSSIAFSLVDVAIQNSSYTVVKVNLNYVSSKSEAWTTCPDRPSNSQSNSLQEIHHSPSLTDGRFVTGLRERAIVIQQDINSRRD